MFSLIASTVGCSPPSGLGATFLNSDIKLLLSTPPRLNPRHRERLAHPPGRQAGPSEATTELGRAAAEAGGDGPAVRRVERRPAARGAVRLAVVAAEVLDGHHGAAVLAASAALGAVEATGAGPARGIEARRLPAGGRAEAAG